MAKLAPASHLLVIIAKPLRCGIYSFHLAVNQVVREALSK